MAGSHILVKSLDSRDAGQLTVLLVHVVGTGAGVVADPDAEVLDLEGVLLADLSFRQPAISSVVCPCHSLHIPR